MCAYWCLCGGHSFGGGGRQRGGKGGGVWAVLFAEVRLCPSSQSGVCAFRAGGCNILWLLSMGRAGWHLGYISSPSPHTSCSNHTPPAHHTLLILNHQQACTVDTWCLQRGGPPYPIALLRSQLPPSPGPPTHSLSSSNPTPTPARAPPSSLWVCRLSLLLRCCPAGRWVPLTCAA